MFFLGNEGGGEDAFLVTKGEERKVIDGNGEIGRSKSGLGGLNRNNLMKSLIGGTLPYRFDDSRGRRGLSLEGSE